MIEEADFALREGDFFSSALNCSRIAWLSSICAAPTDATCTQGRTESVMAESANP